MAKEEKAYRMNLADFSRYLQDKAKDLASLNAESTEVQQRMTEIFRREMTAWQEKFGFCFPRIIALRDTLPPAFAEHLNQIEREERAKLDQEVKDLEAKVASGHTEMDAQLAQAQHASEVLKNNNPQLNNQEEALKAKISDLQDKYAQAYQEIDRLDTFPLGWLANSVKIRKLKKQQKQAKLKQGGLIAQLRQVRQDWANNLQETGETQSTLRTQWEQLSVEVSQAQTRHDHIVANIVDLAEQNAAKRVLEELDTAPDGVQGELGPALVEMVERNRVRHAYEEGMRAVSTAAGLSKGVGGGMAKFVESVGKVLAEQRQYNLKDVKLIIPESVATLNGAWSALSHDIKDDKYLCDHPLEFAAIVDKYVNTYLQDDMIKNMFETMGEALNIATKQWK